MWQVGAVIVMPAWKESPEETIVSISVTPWGETVLKFSTEDELEYSSAGGDDVDELPRSLKDG